MTIFKTLEKMEPNRISKDASVLIRLYKLPKDNQDIVMQITYATNSQNPVDLKDLKANDQKQLQLERALPRLGTPIAEANGYGDESLRYYLWHGGGSDFGRLAIQTTSSEIFLPEHFGKLYETILRMI